MPTEPGAANCCFVSGAAVAWRGHAILLPGRSGSGATELSAALVRAGATPLADGRVEIDREGRIHGSTDTGASNDPLPITLAVSTTYERTAVWQPERLAGARAALALMPYLVDRSQGRQYVLQFFAQLAPFLTTLSGQRPEADAVAPQILSFAETLLGGTEAKPVIAIAAGETGVDEPELAPLREERFLLLMHWMGRFGNRMHQYAYGVTYAKLNSCRFVLPSDWEGTHLFANPQHSVLPRGPLRTELNRAKVPVKPKELHAVVSERFPDAAFVRPWIADENYRRLDTSACYADLCVWHPTVFAAMSRSHLLSLFTFSERVKRLDLYKRLEDRQGTYDIAHMRRDDIASPKFNKNNYQGYSVISKESYERAFVKFGYHPASIEWVSDDYSRRWHSDRVVRKRGRWRYPDGAEVLPEVMFDWLEDFLRLYFARTIFRANSSFSWWAAFLAPHARVFSPVLDKSHIYGIDGMEEIDVEFVEGNHPHWFYGHKDIVIGD